jgi:hypothetical protein
MRRIGIREFFLTTIAIIISCAGAYSQTPSTGALNGVTLYPNETVLPGVVVHIANQDTGASASATSNNDGRFSFLLLAPGRYDVQASRAGFDTLVIMPTINVNVTESVDIELHLRLATVLHTIDVSAEPRMVETNSWALGRVIHKTAISTLPLVTRNFAQLASLSPGVAAGVYNAGELGLGGNSALADCKLQRWNLRPRRALLR